MAKDQEKPIKQTTAYLLGQINTKLETQNGAINGLTEEQKKFTEAIRVLPCGVMEQRVNGLEEARKAKLSRRQAIIVGILIGGGVAAITLLLEKGFG